MKMGIKRLDHVNFITHDMNETIRFYCDVIGLVVGEHLSIDGSVAKTYGSEKRVYSGRA